MENIMKLFDHKKKIKFTKKELHFNKMISRVRVVSENAFGFTCQKFRIFYTTIETQLWVTELIVKVICPLHNIFIDLGEVNLEAFDFKCNVNNVLIPEFEFTEQEA